ncbi:hypothetical protein EFK50_07910 [Nocardioides marmoriginsengisoli]|uniref:CHAP domain-containing protein n=2 Tax=Nocardioides marmoriginsengisoli TaxID=661483 RepID=A0A3N0CJY9_9ACTN|nr:hypothetical protein EFK50_07910 [Nocardioides marmoriginsengisoli]
MCLKMVRGCYGVPAKAEDAATAWADAEHRHPEANPLAIPYGAPVFWTGGSKGHGHIAISTGNGECWSTDIKRPGYFDHVRIAEIERKWGLKLVGWAEDVNGVRIWTAPVKPKPSRPSNWSKVRSDLLAALNSPAAKAIPKSRPVVRAFITLTRRRLTKLPKS